MKRQVGFTLLELLITLTLVSLLSLIVFIALRVSLTAYRKGEERMETLQREKVIVGLIKTQIGSTYPARPQGKFYDPLRAQQSGGAPDAQGGFLERLVAARLMAPPLFKGEERRMLFASFAPLFFKKNAGMSMISYALVPGEKGDTEFVEAEGQYRGGETYLQMSSGEKTKRTIFFPGLEDGTFEYFGAPGQEDYAWYPAWNAESIGRLPLAVRITVTKKNQQRLRIVGLISADAMANPGIGGGGIPPNLRTIIGGGGGQ
ncbi:MAG: prepilin-type N-terminal cleavage/methylation domain-containing protein [Acidobacteria bacterium]|nr:prepilin-type N-terminal cleavage/methylation domain-containing protein [Acidobacteriota bacterium]